MPLHTYKEHRPEIGRDVFIAEGAHVIGRVRIGERSSVWFNAVLRADIQPITVGVRSNIQDNSTVHVDYSHPTIIGDDVTIGHGVTVHGCTVESLVLVGMNAVLLTGCVIGAGSIIGANTLVPENRVIPPRSLVLGTPGRVVRRVTDEEYAELGESASNYADEAATYLQDHHAVLLASTGEQR